VHESYILLDSIFSDFSLPCGLEVRGSENQLTRLVSKQVELRCWSTFNGEMWLEYNTKGAFYCLRATRRDVWSVARQILMLELVT